jgi:hypothetical protein
VNTHDRAGSTFRHPEPVAQDRDGAALGVRGQKFPAEIWLAQYGGMKADDAKRLKELEAENARLKKLVANQVRLSDLQVPAHHVELLAGREEFVALDELADDLITSRGHAKGRQEPLGMPRRFKAFHRPFTLPGGLMRILGPVIQIPRTPIQA